MPALSDCELRHIVPHLKSAGRTEDIHRLLSTSDKKGANLWFSLKEGRDDREGYAIDLQEGLDIALHALIASGDAGDPASVGATLRYVFCLSTLNGFADSIPGQILRELARRGIWNSKTVFDYAKRTPHPARRIESLAAVFGCLELADQDECYWRVCKSIPELGGVSGNEEMLVIFEKEALSRLGDAFLEAERHDLMIRLCEECRTWKGAEALKRNVASALKKIPNIAVAETRRCAQKWYAVTDDLVNRSSFLGLLDESAHDECVAACIAGITSNESALYDSVVVVKSLQQHISAKEFDSIINIVYKRIDSDNTTRRRLNLLIEVLPLLNQERQHKVLREALPFVEQPTWALDEVMGLVTHLCEVPALTPSVVDAIDRVQSDTVRAQLQSLTLATQTATDRDQTIAKSLEAVASFLSRGDRWASEEIIYSLSRLAAFVTPIQVVRLIEAAREVTDHKLRLRALAELLPFVPIGRKDDIIAAEVRDLKSIDNPAIVNRFCSAAGRVASTALLTELPQLLRVPRQRGWFLVGLSRIMSEVRDAKLHRWILDEARDAPESVGYRCLLAIAPYLSLDLMTHAFEIARSLPRTSYRLECCSLIAKLSQQKDLIGQLPGLVKRGLESLREPRERADALIKVLNADPPFQAEALMDDALHSILEEAHLSLRAELIAAAGAWGCQKLARIKADLIEEAFGSVREVVARDALSAIAPSLDRRLVHAVLGRIRNCLDDDLRYESLPEVLARVAAFGDGKQAISCAGELSNETLKGECLAAIAPHLSKSLLLSQLSVYRAIENPYWRDRALSAICVRAAEQRVTVANSQWAAEIQDPVERGKALCAMIPCARDIDQRSLLEEALNSFEATNERMRSHLIEPLAGAMIALPRQKLLEYLVRLLRIMVTQHREELVSQAYGFSSVFRVVGGADAADHVLGGVRDVVQWWP